MASVCAGDGQAAGLTFHPGPAWLRNDSASLVRTFPGEYRNYSYPMSLNRLHGIIKALGFYSLTHLFITAEGSVINSFVYSFNVSQRRYERSITHRIIESELHTAGEWRERKGIILRLLSPHLFFIRPVRKLVTALDGTTALFSRCLAVRMS